MLYNCADLFVYPSLCEGFCLHPFEAMLCEVPVAGSDSGEIPNVIGDSGLVFKEGDINDFFSKLELLINDVDLRRELAKKGWQRVSDNFTQEKVARETYKVYKKIMC